MTSQAIVGGGVLNLMTGREVLADDTFENITWEEATTILSQKIIDAVDSSPLGADSVATYNTGQWTLEEYYAFGKLGKGAIGTSTMDSSYSHDRAESRYDPG